MRLRLAVVLLAVAVPAWAGEVKVSFSNGLVTVVATDASPRQILTEWARLGQVRITNLERLTGGPVTLQMRDVPESQALDTLLRGTAGFVAAPRAATASSSAASRYDRILLMPGLAPAVAATTAGAPAPTPPMNRGRMNVPTFDANDGDMAEIMRAQRGGMLQPPQQPGAASPGFYFSGQTQTPGQSVSPGQEDAMRARQVITYPQTVPGEAGGQAAGQGRVGGVANQAAPNPNTGKTPGAPTPGASTPGAMTQPPPTQPGPIKKDPGGEG
jgi:hypothetical protein